VIGSAFPAGMFATTLGFLFTTPGVVLPGQFRIEDAVLFAVGEHCLPAA